MKPSTSKVKILTASALLSVSILLFAPGAVALAQTDIGRTIGIDPVPGAPDRPGDLVDLLRGIVRWVYIIFFIVAVLFIIFAAFTYLTAGGDPEKVGKAKNMIIYATVAIGVALLAVSFEAIIRNFISQPLG